MKKALLGVLVVMVAGLSACTGPIVAFRDPVTGHDQVLMESYWMQSWTRVDPPIPTRVPGGGLSVAVPIRSLNDFDLLVDYTYRFFGPNGTQVEEPGKGSIRIGRKGQGEIKFTSMTPMAAEFQVTLRYRKVEG